MKNYFKKSNVQPRGSDFVVCSEIMSRVNDLAPSDASVSARISRLADGSYYTMIPVCAADKVFENGKFFAEAKAQSLVSSLKAAQHQILKKLRVWKAERF